MPRSRKIRRRPATPSFKFDQEHYQHPHTADPTSPPETPTTSPPFSRKISLKPRHQPDFHDFFQPLASDPNIRPVGDGHQFSYQPNLRPEQLSPRSSSSSSDEDVEESSVEESSESASVGGMPNVQGPLMSIEMDDEMDDDDDDEGDDEDDDDDEDEDEDSEAESTDSDNSSNSDASRVSIHQELHVTTTTTFVDCNFTLEEVDVMDSDCDGLDVLLPTEIESNRSQSRERHRKDHNGMVHEFRNLNCSNETSDNEVGPTPTPPGSPEGDFDYDEAAFLRRREALKKLRRMSMGSSFGKRTHSEVSDSDDDIDGLDVHEVGSSARRLRRKLHRTSLLFHDPPPARIDELEEPDSSEDEFLPRQSLARELPYWTMEIMEMDSSPR